MGTGGNGDEHGCAVGVGCDPDRVEPSAGNGSLAAFEREEFARSASGDAEYHEASSRRSDVDGSEP